MPLSLHIPTFLALVAVLACAAGDDLVAFKATLQKLCEANKDGAYGTCCSKNNDGQNIASISALPTCLGSTYVSNNLVQRLFVSNTACSSEICCECFCYIQSKGLTTIPSGAFSGLSSLVFLQLSASGR